MRINKSLLLALFLQQLTGAVAAVPADSRYSIHTSGLNSSVYVNMLYFANLVNQYATDFTLVTLPSEGGPSNMISVNDGRASFGTSTAESVKEAYDGIGEFQGRPQSRIRHVASFGFSLMFIYTHPDSNIQSVSDLKGRKIVYGGGTGSAVIGKQILDVYGIATDVTAVRGDTDKARAALERKEIDAIFSIARLPVPAYSEMVKRQTLKIIPLDAAGVQALQKRSPLYVEVDIKTYYPDYPRSARAIGLPGPLVARDDINLGVVYQMLKIVYSRMTELQKMNDGFRGDSPATGLRGLAIPLHPGAEKFFSELGLSK
ncbi:MAG TPA: TAXI family TRAP transporter solute-binding subunit [Candidatus Binatia bacterium]|nr:TAXI family TRAP transporter solute-binding subunit [Candidatus Binatia bacterium]